MEEQEKLREHEEKEHGWKSERCISQYISAQGWKEHLKKRHRIEYNCTQCRKGFEYEEELKEHVRREHRIKFICEQCEN